MKVIPCLLLLFLATVNCNQGSVPAKSSEEFSLDPKENKSLVVIGGDVYFIGTSPKMHWLDSLRMCTSMGMTLASFEYQEKFDLMVEYLQTTPEYYQGHWTSGARTIEDAWLWTNLGRELSSDAPWADGQPGLNGVPLDVCLLLVADDSYPGDVGFYDFQCDLTSRFNFICQLSS